jgi:hypothetical protein
MREFRGVGHPQRALFPHLCVWRSRPPGQANFCVVIKQIVSAAVLALVAVLPAVVSAAPVVPQVTVQARAHINSFSTVNANVKFADNGTTLTVTGVGSGFTPGLAFVSLVYATPSYTNGALACLPPTPNPFSPPQMFVAYWLPMFGGSERYLQVQKTGTAYVPLTSIDTISVRYDSTPQVGNPAATTQTPGRYFLQSCGDVTSHR